MMTPKIKLEEHFAQMREKDLARINELYGEKATLSMANLNLVAQIAALKGRLKRHHTASLGSSKLN